MHGGGSLWNIQRYDHARSTARDVPSAISPYLAGAKTSCPLSQSTSTGSRAETAGFRHFLGKKVPNEAQRFTIDGKPFDPETMLVRADDLMRKLVLRIQDEERSTDPGIPSGYTYFLQLVAHDIVHSTLVISRNAGSKLGLANARRSPLRLETIYGGGPTECPSAYETNPDSFRKKLRLGRIKGGAGSREEIARARAETDKDDAGYPEPLVGDPRNDSHAILSQLVALAHHVHNDILQLIENTVGKGTEDTFARDQWVFAAAQAAVIMIYRDRIRHDLLPRILHPAVVAAYENGSVSLLDEDSGLGQGYWLAPLEFTHGFFRFAHSMVRNRYTLNDDLKIGQQDANQFDLALILRQNSELCPKAMPFAPEWAIKWKYFFSDKFAGTNFSVRIGPWDKMPVGNVLGKDPLWYRDLVSSVLMRPWSIAALIDEIRLSHGKLLDSSALLKDAGSKNRTWAPDLQKWLLKPTEATGATRMSEDEAKTLADDPPIPFFVRYEAYKESQGKHLGVLGSIVVADVFYSIIKQDRIMDIECSGPLAPQLEKLSIRMFGRNDVFAEISDPSALDAFIASIGSDTGFPVGSKPT